MANKVAVFPKGESPSDLRQCVTQTLINVLFSISGHQTDGVFPKQTLSYSVFHQYTKRPQTISSDSYSQGKLRSVFTNTLNIDEIIINLLPGILHTVQYLACSFNFHNYSEHYLYTPSGDQPIGVQEMKIRGVH